MLYGEWRIEKFIVSTWFAPVSTNCALFSTNLLTTLALFGLQQNKSTTNQNNQNNNKTETGKERALIRWEGVHD